MLQPYPPSLHIHQFAGLLPGPRLIILGAVHGNETCGTVAIKQLLQQLEQGQLAIRRGCLTLVPICNPLAYSLQQRQGHRNLNRNLRLNTSPQGYEDHLANILCPLLSNHDVLLDLHSFHTAGQAFALAGPPNNDGNLEPFTHADAEATLLAHMPVQRIVEGWMEVYQKGVLRRRQHQPTAPAMLLDTAYGIGTTEFIRASGGYGITLECGQHEDAAAPVLAYKAIQQTLALLQMADLPLQAPQTPQQVIRLDDVIDLHHPQDRFARPWQSFDPIKEGDVIGVRATGDQLTAPRDGWIVFPNPQALPNNEWFYFAIDSKRCF